MSIFICAEIGINHNGDMDICKQLIDVAVETGCDAVKFQKRDIDIVYSKELLDSPRESPWGTTQRDQKLGLEFELEQYKEIDKYCNHKNIDWYASSWDLKSQDFLKQFNCKYNKIASAMLIFDDLLKEVAREGKHTFISTGMSTIEQIDHAVEIFKAAQCPFELMHTVSTYPMKDEHANLNMIPALREKYSVNVGYSGHETGVAISIAAAVLGISSLERHITIDRSMYGSDQAASLAPVGLQNLVGSVRKVENAMGNGVKYILDEERPVAAKLREHLN